MAFIPEQVLEGEDYNKSFNPATYNQVFWSEEPDPEMDLTHVRDFMVETLCKHFAQIGEHEKLLDLGCGPSFHGTLASRAKEIYSADFAKVNLEALKKWLAGDEKYMGISWDHVIKYFASKLNRDWKDLKNSVKSRNKGVFHCDVLKPGCALTTTEAGQKVASKFDVIVTLYCFEAAAKTNEEYKSVVKRAVDLLNPGGHMIYIGNLNESFYPTAPDQFFWVLNLKKETVVSSLEAAGMKVLQFETVDIFPPEDGQPTGQVFGLLAKKT